ncbi:MAG TPA: thiamine-binding protein [Planctomycetota bacterium]|nr:thiamine-binding protein [Planctomycetota bacterium]
MNVQAEVSLYPLRTAAVGPAVEDFIACLRRADLHAEVGPMSTRITGECTKLFAALAESFAAAVSDYQVVLVAKVSNACPVSAQQTREHNDAKPT